MNTEPKERMTLDEQIERALIVMNGYSVGSEEYLTAAKAVEALCQARSHARATTTIKGIPIETIIAASVNILGILLVINHERFDVITTKAFGMISKGRNI